MCPIPTAPSRISTRWSNHDVGGDCQVAPHTPTNPRRKFVTYAYTMMFRIIAPFAAVALLALSSVVLSGSVPTALAAAKPSPSPRNSPTPTPRPVESLTPDQILSRTEATLRRNPDPTYIVYKMREVFVHHGKTHDYNYQVWYRNDGKGLMQDTGPGRRGKNETFFGYPFPSAPDNNILLYATPPPRIPPPPPVGTSAPGSASGSPAPILTHETVSGDRYYVVSLTGIENYEGHTVYHLTLRAVRDENKHPWKDLWVDAQNFQVWKAHADAGGNVGPLSGRAAADVEFAPVGNYWMVKQASADGEGHLGFISDSGHYEYYFSDFDFPITLPDWYFDEAAFNRHRP